MFEVVKTQGRAAAGRVYLCPRHSPDPCFHERGHPGRHQGCGVGPRPEGCGLPDRAVQYLPPAPAPRVTMWCSEMGGLHKFMGWDGPILTDSGGFQVFSLAGLRKITRGGRHLRLPSSTGAGSSWGRRRACASSRNLGSDIAMAFDECVENPATL